MASSDSAPPPSPYSQNTSCDGQTPPGKDMSVGQHLLDKGAHMFQSFKPIKQMSQHICTFALYSHDTTRHIETHHYAARINSDVLQCAVYDSDSPLARLIGNTSPSKNTFENDGIAGVEYIVSDSLFEELPPEEQRLWHSHAYEIKAGLWINPSVPEAVIKPELRSLARTYGKFWCTWQVDRGDDLPMGPPALMMSPQPVNMGMVPPVLVNDRDTKYRVASESLKESRKEIAEPEWINPNADYWKQHGKGFAIDLQPVQMKCRGPFP